MKRMMYGLLMIVFVSAVVLGLGACAKKTPEPKPIETIASGALKGAPDWVIKGCAGKQMACGIGACGGSRNISLMRSTALTRARADLAKNMETDLKVLNKSNQATVTGGEKYGTAASDEQLSQETIKEFTHTTLTGTEQIDAWVGEDGTYWALVSINPDKFRESVSKMKNLSENMRNVIEERAQKAFDELDEEAKKKSEQ
jgi:hypothetical protein